MLNVTQHAAKINLSRKFFFLLVPSRSFVRSLARLAAVRNLLCAINICIRPIFDTNSHTQRIVCHNADYVVVFFSLLLLLLLL